MENWQPLARVIDPDTQPFLPLVDGGRIPQLGFGTYKITEPNEAYRCVRTALDLGYRLIDTAHFYGNEAEVGKAIKDSGIDRAQVFLTTKIWNDAQRAGTQREQFAQSLKLLGLDYVDLLLIHWPVKGRYLATWDILQELHADKVAAHVGVCNFKRHHLEDLFAHGGPVPALDQMEHHPYLQDTDTLAFCRKHGIVYQAWSPLGRGKVLADETLARIARAHGKTVAQVVLRWQLDEGLSTIPKSVTTQRIKENLGALDFSLTPEECALIDALDKNERVNPKSDPDTFEF